MAGVLVMAGEIWAAGVAFNAERSLLSAVFTTTPEMATRPVCLSLWGWRVNYLSRGKMMPQSNIDLAIHHWINGEPQVGQVVPLARRAEMGLYLVGLDVHAEACIGAA